MIDPDVTLLDVARLVFSDMRELFDVDGNLRPVHEMPNHLAAAIASIKIVRRKLTAGDALVVIQKVQFWDKCKALEMLFKHLGLLKGRAHLSDDAELMARLEARRKYTAGKT